MSISSAQTYCISAQEDRDGDVFYTLQVWDAAGSEIVYRTSYDYDTLSEFLNVNHPFAQEL